MILRQFTTYKPKEITPFPLFYRLTVINRGIIGDCKDWRLLVMIRDTLFEGEMCTVYPVYEPSVYTSRNTID